MCSLLEAGAADFDGMLVSFKSSDLPPGAIPKQGDKDEVRVRVEEVQVDDDDDGEEDGDRAEGEPQQKDHVVVRDDSPKKSLQDDMEDSSSATLAATETTGPHFPTSNTPLPDAPTFHGFGALPAELRIKIWSLSFGPRVVELRPTRPNSPNWAPARTDDRRPQWQSGCTNPAALSVSVEARELALAHFRIGLPLARLAPSRPPPTDGDKDYEEAADDNDDDDQWRDVSTGAAVQYLGGSSRFGTCTTTSTKRPSGSRNSKKTTTTTTTTRLLKRVLYVSPEHDTVVMLGLDSDLIRLTSLLATFREADPGPPGGAAAAAAAGHGHGEGGGGGGGLRRLGLSVRDWGYGGSAFMLQGLARSWFKDLDQLVFFLYSEPHPPDGFVEKGAACADESEEGSGTVTEALAKFRATGNTCALVDPQQCGSSGSGSSSGGMLDAYRMWSGGRGRQFRDGEGRFLKVGRLGNDLEIMDLEFKDGW